MRYSTDDLRITAMNRIDSPKEIMAEYPLTDEASETVYQARFNAHNIIHGEDDRLLVVIGPCSIHDAHAALEYADKLIKLRDELKDDLHIIMRVYFEKPRTNIGWKGLINDPNPDDTFDIQTGLRKARKLLLDLSNKGMPAATEYLDLITPQYVADLVSWAAIGARTTESQGHRELSSGVSCPIGFKNGTYGNLDVAIHALLAAQEKHHFLSTTKRGRSAIFSTKGNNDCHIILRGGRQPNYQAECVEEAVQALKNEGLSPYLMIDISHSNSDKDYRKQPIVAEDIAQQISQGNTAISGVMIESHLKEGRQQRDKNNLAKLVYGQSITDACIGWEDTEKVLKQLAEAVQKRRVSS